jgi:hypothetical protein
MSREGGKDVQTNRRQPEDLSRFRNVRSKPEQETVAASDKDVESKTRTNTSPGSTCKMTSP